MWRQFQSQKPAATAEEMKGFAEKLIKRWNLDKFPGGTVRAPFMIFVDTCSVNPEIHSWCPGNVYNKTY